MSGSDENGSPGVGEKAEGAPVNEHLNIKVTDNNNEVFFKIKRTTALKKLMDAFCERQGKAPNSLDMQDGDTLEVHQEQIGGAY
ncbi:Ubiquitin SMT3 [Hyphodiscus hymeniophilus]|uniref:Ubiquitin SMT3 n=1 Tax=Hyphodiscus hymeniophilus TaxID=353542 RepID=A0A9P7AXJ7_9HELO|nr:Ubiquitin SMT3 [Hyphodiscus hymeniophilus]